MDERAARVVRLIGTDVNTAMAHTRLACQVIFRDGYAFGCTLVDTDRTLTQLESIEGDRKIATVKQDIAFARIAAFDGRITDVSGRDFADDERTTVQVAAFNDFIAMVGELIDLTTGTVTIENRVDDVETGAIECAAVVSRLVVDDGRTHDVEIGSLMEDSTTAFIIAPSSSVVGNDTTHQVGFSMAFARWFVINATALVVSHHTVGHIHEILRENLNSHRVYI